MDFAEPAWERIRFVQLDATDHLHWYTKERGDEVTLPRDAPGWAWVLTRAKELELVEKRGGRREEAPAVAKIRNGAS